MEIVKKGVSINSNLKETIRYYLIFTKYLNKLRPKEIDLLTEMIYMYLIQKENFKHEEDLWKKVFDYDSKLVYKELLGLQDYSLQSLLTSLRKKKVVIDNKIKSNIIPKIEKETSRFQLIFDFKLSNG